MNNSFYFIFIKSETDCYLENNKAEHKMVTLQICMD